MAKKPKWTPREKYWFKKRGYKYLLTVFTYIVLGGPIVNLVTKLNGVMDEISANIIVFGFIGLVVFTILDIMDSD